MRNTSVWFLTPLFSFLFILESAAPDARAGLISLRAGFAFSGAPPAGPVPWLTATFDDQGSAGSVNMTLNAANLTGEEFVTGWYLNLDPALGPSSLTFSMPTKVGAFDIPTISLGADSFKADGDGRYDILLAFPTPDGSDARFTAGDALTYTITGIPSLIASSFDFPSAPAGGLGPYPMAVHVQGIGVNAEESGWATVPEPATMASLAPLAVLALMARRRRSRF